MKSFFKNAGLALMATALLTVASCGKDDEPAPQTRMQLLTTGTWKLQAVDMGMNGNFVPMIGQLDACERDNTITFRTNFIFTEDEGPTKCSPADRQSVDASWRFENNETQIVINGNVYDFEGKIDRLDASTLVISDSEVLNGQTVVYRVTMVK